MSKNRRLLFLYYLGLFLLAQGLNLAMDASGTFAIVMGIGIVIHVIAEILE